MTHIVQTLLVSAGADDGSWTPTSVDTIFTNSANSLIAGLNAAIGDESEHSFMRFLAADIDKNFPIQSAILGVTVTINQGAILRIYGEKAANPAAVTSAANGDSRALTTAYVDWVPSGTGRLLIDVTAILQEIVNQSTWAPGNALQLFVKDNASIVGAVFWRSVNFSSGVAAPSLLITCPPVPGFRDDIRPFGLRVRPYEDGLRPYGGRPWR